VTPALPEPLPEDPLPMVKAWLEQGFAAARNGNAMALATVDEGGRPAVRMVLCRGFDECAGWFVFYTDRESAKGRALAKNPRAGLVWYWEPLERQIRVEGPVTLAPDRDCDTYWEGRPLDARLAAIASEQSEPIESRAAFLARIDVARRDHGERGPRPARWGGYRVWAERLELWVSQPARAHDRAVWWRSLAPAGDGYRPGPWSRTRLQP
jgi:pyridoxamine 5'-phosphate oxidase